MAKDAFLALTIRNLPTGTTKQDVIDHINRAASNACPVVGPIVRDPNQPTFYTTVTIRQDSDDKCKTLRDKLNLTEFFPRAPQTNVRDSKIVVNDEFLGVTTVAEHENPQFEYVPHLTNLSGLVSHAAVQCLLHTWTWWSCVSELEYRPARGLSTNVAQGFLST